MKRSSGFTIIELMIVIAIVGILIACNSTVLFKHRDRDSLHNWRPHPIGPEYGGTKYECEQGRVVDHTSSRTPVAVYDEHGKPVPCAPDGS